MNNHRSYQNTELLKGVVMLCSGILLFIFGQINFNLQVLIPYLHLIEGIGLFLFVVGGWNLLQYFRNKKNPAALHKARVESMDERKLWIQYRSGSNAFKVGVTTTYLALLAAGATENNISSNLVWWVLAGIVVTTLLVYVASLLRYERIY
ncbi:MAG: hypothetical protein Q8S01_14190 [Ignavibacteria bacterium]|nr:hypothetical protein [Ignavibacteria bacterium]